MKNIDDGVVSDFGREWSDFDQGEVPDAELHETFQRYFSLFPWAELPAHARGFDLGCGSGRWARFCAPRVGELHCIEPAAAALEIAQAKLAEMDNCVFHTASVDAIPLPDASMDFCYSLGVLHHVPDTLAGIRSCAKKLKPGAPFLLYLYYAFDRRPLWFKALWRASDALRKVVSRLPYPAKYAVCQAIAFIIYLPLSRLARVGARLRLDVRNWPLSAYGTKSYYSLRTDALDRFGTRLEKRFTRKQITHMMVAAGLERIAFRDEEPFWCALGYKEA